MNKIKRRRVKKKQVKGNENDHEYKICWHISVPCVGKCENRRKTFLYNFVRFSSSSH